MEVIVIVLIPVLFLTLAASMLVVSQISGFFQSGRYSRKRQQDRKDLDRFMTQLGVAQGQVFKRSKDLEKMSSRLKVNNTELERLNGMKSKFLSMVVHDMRTPLASIKGFGEMLSRQKLEGPQKKYTDYIVRGTDQINHLMADLTDLAVIEAGKLRMEKAEFMLHDLLNDMVPPTQVIAKQRGVEFVAPEDVKNIPLIGDKFRLGQALMNFLNNATKFTPNGGRVELKVIPHGRTVTFAVKDSGPGIHPSERRNVFEKFYQSKFQTKKDKKKGWGLGLSIAQEIVMAHQGEIGVDSPGLGKGATFWYRVPVKPPRRAPHAVAAALLMGLLLAAAPLRAQEPYPLEDKRNYEKALELKAESVLLRILGPNRYRVVVDASLDFTRIEKFDIAEGAAEGEKALFLWQNVGAESSGRDQLLPGIPSPQPVPGAGGAKSYKRENSFPTSFVKRLGVTVILDKGIERAQGDEMSKIIAEILDVQPGRGDVLNLIYAPFEPAWKTIWHTPEAVSLIFKYGMISLMTLITLIVVAVCFLKLAEAMDSMAQAQATQLSMDMGQGDGTTEEEEEEKKAIEGEQEGEGSPTGIFFAVKPEQVETLYEIIHNQDPENIALVVAHLHEDVKKLFLARLEPAVYSQVLMNLGKIKFMEPDVVETVKDELERRLESAVGGQGKLLAMIEESDLKTKRQLLELLEERDPELAKVVRQKIILFEDLLLLNEKDWSLLFGALSLEDWGRALTGVDEAIINAVKGQMLEKTWAITQQMMQAQGVSEGAAEKARENVVEVLEAMVAKGRIENPANRRKELAAPEESLEPPPLEEDATPAA
jgi:signal transduction histidine kinase/flagellar motor switch protein FliG